jgi:hypothetical protein
MLGSGHLAISIGPCASAVVVSVDSSQRVSRLLDAVRLLTETMLADTHPWVATTEQSRFLLEVSARTGQLLPEESVRTASVTLGFLLMAQFSLGAKLRGEFPARTIKLGRWESSSRFS